MTLTTWVTERIKANHFWESRQSSRIYIFDIPIERLNRGSQLAVVRFICSANALPSLPVFMLAWNRRTACAAA